MKLYSIWILLTLLIVSCENTKQNQFIALVGDTLIKEKDIDYTIKIEKIYGSGDVSREEALIVLIDDALEIEVGKLIGVSVKGKDIEELEIKLQNNKSKDNRFEEVRKIFKTDSPDYSRLYLQPMMLNKKLRIFFKQNKNNNTSSIQSIIKAKELIDKGQSFELTSNSNNLEYKKYDIGGKNTNKNEEVPQELQNYIQKEKDKDSEDPIISIVTALDEGAVFKNIVEDSDSYRIVKLIKKNKEVYTIETVTSNKKTIIDWYRKTGQEIKINISDQNKKALIKRNYPDLWWVENL